MHTEVLLSAEHPSIRLRASSYEGALAAGGLSEITLIGIMELLGAERGFLILEEEEDVSVAVARNFDRRSLEEGSQRFSRSIAATVLAASPCQTRAQRGRGATRSAGRRRSPSRPR